MMSEPEGRGTLSFELRNDLSEIAALADTLERFGDQLGIGQEMMLAVNLAIEEIITNIISYGYTDGSEHRIRIDLAHDGVSLSARIEDDAVAFDPLLKEDPDLDVPLEARRVGGLGIHLVKTLMDEVRYSREQGHNVIFIRKATAAQV